jgi:hypothetical protein
VCVCVCVSLSLALSPHSSHRSALGKISHIFPWEGDIVTEIFGDPVAVQHGALCAQMCVHCGL